MRRVTLKAGLISFVVCAMLAGVAPMAAAGASPKAAGGLGAAAGYAVLAGTALTCTDSNVAGPVGVDFTTAVTSTNCTMQVAKFAPGAYAGFTSRYQAIAGSLTPCTVLTGTLDQSLGAGTYCFDAAATFTGTTLTLTGTGPWLFEIGTQAVGALTGTNFTVLGSNPCNVTWWVHNDVTFTDSALQGTILGGGAITLTRTSLTGRALATGAVTMTDSTIVGCTGGGTGARQHCNQGVGNGPEGCDPGNSNNHNPSNDELGGTPSHPGRQGGNHNASVGAKGNSALHGNARSK